MKLSTALASYVRALPDETILELVRHHLAPRAVASRSRTRAVTSAARQHGGGRGVLVDRVADVVRESRGLALAEVAKAARESDKRRVGAVLRTLRSQGRVACAGDRRNARWAGDMATARAAVAIG